MLEPIRLEALSDVIPVPFQAVLEHRGNHYCVQMDGPNVKPLAVTVGSNNNETVVILKGLEVGRQIVLKAEPHRDALDLSQFPPKSPEADGKGESNARTESDSEDSIPFVFPR